jgi:hypothetical protein
LSGGSFQFVGNGSANSAAAPPKVGAVMSIGGFDGLPYGHVGIVSNVEPAANGGYVVTLFDQNWPTNAWKQVILKNVEGTLVGTMSNSKAPNGIMDVVGWANPS